MCHLKSIGMTPQELSDRLWRIAARIAKVADALLDSRHPMTNNKFSMTNSQSRSSKS
jgi:diadenosine tetraphosphate (Ap4A) HIT family hydrolase